MLEFIDVIKWPLALIVCFVIALLMFRSAVTTLLGRAQRAGFGKSAIDFGAAPAEQQKALEPPTNTPVSTVPADAIRPPPMEIYAGIENETKTALEASKYPLELQNAWLMRAAAVFRVMRDHEIAYHLILGSQIDLLLAANTAPLPNMARARETFDAAKARSPDFYTNFSFDAWLHYLVVSTKLVQITAVGGDQFLRTKTLGQDFLRYLVDNHLTSPKAG